MTPPASRVLVVSSHLPRSDRIIGELTEVGLEPTPAFSAGEAVGLLSSEPFEALVIDEGLEEGIGSLLRWVGEKYKGVVVSLPALESSPIDDDAIEDWADEGLAASLVLALGTSSTRGSP